jgi:hypothetical protein
MIRGGKDGCRPMETGPKQSDIPSHLTSSSTWSTKLQQTKKDSTSSGSLCGLCRLLTIWGISWGTKSSDSHYSSLSRCHITFHPSSVTLTLPDSKTDQVRVGTDIYLAYSPHSSICPVTALRNLFRCYPKPAHSPLFTRPRHPFSNPYFVFKNFS